MVNIRRNQSRTQTNSSKSVSILVTIILCTLSFYTGTILSPPSSSQPILTSSSTASSITAADCIKFQNEHGIEVVHAHKNEKEDQDEEERIEAIVQKRVHELLVAHNGHEMEEEQFHKNKQQSNQEEEEKGKSASDSSSSSSSSSSAPLFTPSHSAIISGIARVSKDEFVTKYDYGPPMDKGEGSNGQDAIVLYNNAKSIPSSNEDHTNQIKNGDANHNKHGSGIIPLLSTEEAIENCDTMNVVTVGNPGNTHQCTVLVNNYENYHTQRWMRVPSPTGKLDHKEPLRAVSRGYASNGSRHFQPPDDKSISKHWKTLYTYFDTLEDVLSKLKPVAESVAKDNTIIVMTCNMGQSELLMNFVCNAKAKGLDVDNVLVFPTDEETKDLAEGLGLATFYDEKNFENMPSGEAKAYGDRTFIAMMFAKVICVQLINHLGYDLLFQDVDMVWYKNPLEYFHDTSNPYHDFDMYFQDDGAHSSRYAPYSANSGFYYVRNNEKTKYLLTSLLYHGDMILQSSSHQQALIQLLTNHASLFGLRVKVLGRDMEEFPGGWHYHRRSREFMKKVVKDEVTPYIFHMSWTKNKDNKVKFLQQMGQWYVEDKCISKPRDSILAVDPTSEENGENNAVTNQSIIEPCCLAEPNIVCHYRDKPSKIPCKGSNPIDKGGASFW